MDKSKAAHIAMVGGESLIGREIRELLSTPKPAPVVELISGEAADPKIARDDEGEAIVLSPMNAEVLGRAQAVVLAGSRASSLHALELTAGTRTPLIDLTGALEDQPKARLRSPLVEPAPESDVRIHVIAHPAATLLALFYARIQKRWPVRQSVVTVFEPASQSGQSGLTELQTQTVNLLSFKALPKDVFDAQVGFNLLPALGTEVATPLERIETSLDGHLATLLLKSSGAPPPSLRLVQAPVFHGYSCSVWMELESSPTVREIEQGLASAQIEVRTRDQEPASNVGAAAQSGLTAGDIRKDRNNAHAYWVWLVADNIRTSGETAVAVLREYL